MIRKMLIIRSEYQKLYTTSQILHPDALKSEFKHQGLKCHFPLWLNV